MQSDTGNECSAQKIGKKHGSTTEESQAHPSVTLLFLNETSNCISWIQGSKNSITILEDAPHFEYIEVGTALLSFLLPCALSLTSDTRRFCKNYVFLRKHPSNVSNRERSFLYLLKSYLKCSKCADVPCLFPQIHRVCDTFDVAKGHERLFVSREDQILESKMM